jgi:hypothetical protein
MAIDFKDVTELWNSFGAFRTRRETKWRPLRNREIDADLGKLYHDVGLRYKSFDPQHEAFQYTAALNTASTTFAIKARVDDSTIQESAQNFEYWMNAAVPLLNVGKSSPLSLSRSYVACDGVAVWKFDLNPDWIKKPNEGDEDYRKRLEQERKAKLQLGLPFVWSAPDPTTCAWFEDGEDTPVMVERCKRRINPILKAFDLQPQDVPFLKLGEGTGEFGGSTLMKQVTFTQVSTPETIYYYIDQAGGQKTKGEAIAERPNPWGRVPYVVVPGMLQAGSTDPDKRYLPLILAALVMAEYENFGESLRMLAAYLTCAPTYDLVMDKTTGQEFIGDPRSGQPLEIEVVPGQPLVRILPAPLVQRTVQAGIDMDKMLNRFRMDRDRYGFPTGLMGMTPEPRVPAIALAESAEKAMLRLDPALRQEEAAFTEMARMFGYVIKNYIKEEVPIYTVIEDEEGNPKDEVLKIAGDDIHEYDIAVGVTVVSTSLQLAKSEQYGNAVDKRRMPKGMYMEEILGIKDVAKSLRQMEDEQLDEVLTQWDLHMVLAAAAREQRDEQGIELPVPPPTGAVPTAGPGRAAQQVRVPGTAGEPLPLTSTAVPPPAGGIP